MDHVLNVKKVFMDVSVYHVVMDVTVQYVDNLMVGVNVSLVTTRKKVHNVCPVHRTVKPHVITHSTVTAVKMDIMVISVTKPAQISV